MTTNMTVDDDAAVPSPFHRAVMTRASMGAGVIRGFQARPRTTTSWGARSAASANHS